MAGHWLLVRHWRRVTTLRAVALQWRRVALALCLQAYAHLVFTNLAPADFYFRRFTGFTCLNDAGELPAELEYELLLPGVHCHLLCGWLR